MSRKPPAPATSADEMQQTNDPGNVDPGTLRKPCEDTLINGFHRSEPSSSQPPSKSEVSHLSSQSSRSDYLPSEASTSSSSSSSSSASSSASLVDFFGKLPVELALAVVGWADLHGVIALSSVNHMCHLLANDEEIWRSLYVSTWSLHLLPKPDVRLPSFLCSSWRQLFRERRTLEWDHCSIKLDEISHPDLDFELEEAPDGQVALEEGDAEEEEGEGEGEGGEGGSSDGEEDEEEEEDEEAEEDGEEDEGVGGGEEVWDDENVEGGGWVGDVAVDGGDVGPSSSTSAILVVGAGEIGGSGSAAGSKIGDGSTSKRRKKRSSSRNKKNVKRKSEGSNLEGEDGNDHGDTNDVNHDANSVDNIRHHEDDHQGHDHDNQGHWQPETETNNIGDNNTSTNTSKRKKKKNRVLPPRAVIQGKGKYLGRKLMWPRTGKEWLAWGHILQKRVESVRIGRVDRKKDRKEVEARDEAYFENKKRYHEEIGRLLLIACEEYASSVSMCALYPEVLPGGASVAYVSMNNWGISLAEVARMKTAYLSDSLFRLAYQKIKRTADMRAKSPDLWWVLSEWAVTLRANAARRLSEGLLTIEIDNVRNSVDDLFRESCEKLEAANKLNPHDAQILSEWADALSEHATSKIRATAKTIRPLDPEVLKEADDLFRASYVRYDEAIGKWYPEDGDQDVVLSNYGLALSDHAMVVTPSEESEELFRRSYEKYSQAATARPNNTLTQCNLAMTYVLHSCTLKEGQEEMRQKLWDKADEILRGQLIKNDIWTFFCLARLASVRDREDECKEWLAKCEGKNYLAKKTKWFSIHFANMQRRGWFEDLRKQQIQERRRQKSLLQ